MFMCVSKCRAAISPGFAAHQGLSETPCHAGLIFFGLLGPSREWECGCREERHHPRDLVMVERPC